MWNWIFGCWIGLVLSIFCLTNPVRDNPASWGEFPSIFREKLSCLYLKGKNNFIVAYFWLPLTVREIEKKYFQTGIRTQALVTTFKLWLVLHTSLISTQSLSRGLISFIEFAKNSDIAKSRLDDVLQEIWKLTQQRNLKCLKPKTIHPRQLVHSFEFSVLTAVKFSITYHTYFLNLLADGHDVFTLDVFGYAIEDFD